MPEGPLAHRVEQGTFNPKVPGSSPGRPTTKAARRQALKELLGLDEPLLGPGYATGPPMWRVASTWLSRSSPPMDAILDDQSCGRSSTHRALIAHKIRLVTT